ncbi:MAG: alpha/beta hydrolase [Verrucomicrobiales bacterium]|nr:alpha/beta hydrolase [Verrucomicrobiales bacterium]
MKNHPHSILPAAFALVCAVLMVSHALGADKSDRKSEGGRRVYHEVPDTVECVKDVSFGTGGTPPLRLDIYRPKKRGDAPLPVVIYIHGGGWMEGDKAEKHSSDAALQLAEAGFFVASINYRLSGEAAFPAAIEDCKCAVRFLRAHGGQYGIRTERIGAWGMSAGGHLSLLLGTSGGMTPLEGLGGWAEQSSRVQAVVSFYGPTDLALRAGKHQRGKAEPKPRPDKRSGKRDPEGQFLGGTFAEKPKAYRLASPITHVTPDDPPTFLVHGAEDRGVPPEQSRRMADALKSAGVPAELVIVPGAGHGFYSLGADKVRELGQRAVEFFRRELSANPATSTVPVKTQIQTPRAVP